MSSFTLNSNHSLQMEKYKLLFQIKSYIYVHKVIGIHNMVFKMKSSKLFNEILYYDLLVFLPILYFVKT